MMTAQDVGLTEEEAVYVRELVGREPSDLEWGLFGVLWSEHCSYKSSRTRLRWLPKEGAAVVAGPGGNAGVVRLDDAVEVAFKVESHNHPSFVEPVQGAATGVGGIIRDVVAMGARPIALMDSLRFGSRSTAIREGVVRGIGDYGNAIGVPTVGGEVFYGPGYAKNPLVNVLCVGLRRPGREIGAGGARPGEDVYLIGQATGRDGIHGASLLASRDFSQADQDLRPTVQVGDPYTGKLLMEATLAALATGRVSALQDLGAAGLASASSELAVRSGVGLALDLDHVPCREARMTAYEIMLSETQERMLLVLDAVHGEEALAAIRSWGLVPKKIGTTTADGQYVLTLQGKRVAVLEAQWLVDGCPLKPAPAPRVAPPPVGTGSPPEPVSPQALVAMLADPDLRSREPIYRRYDSMIQTRTVWGPEHEVAVLRLKESPGGLAISVAGPGRWAAVDAYSGGAGAVALAVARLAVQAVQPLGLTDGLNAGNPDQPETLTAFSQMILGIRDAALALGVPVTGGNVSFHNETDAVAIWPTPIIGAVGRHPRPDRPWADVVTQAGMRIVLINPPTRPELGGSVWERRAGRLTAYPRVGLDRLRRTVGWLRQALLNDALGIEAVRAVAEGGLWLTLVKLLGLGGPGGAGIAVTLADEMLAERLLNEVVGQFVLTVDENHWPEVMAELSALQIDSSVLGRTVAEDGLGLTVGSGSEAFTWHWARGELLAAWSAWEGA